MNIGDLQRYPLLTRLSAAIYAEDTQLAQQLLHQAVFDRYEGTVVNSILRGKKLARPGAPLPPDNDPFAGLTNEGDVRD